MSADERNVQQKFEKLLLEWTVPTSEALPQEASAKKSLSDETRKLTYAQKKQEQELRHADREMAQREIYAGRVFVLVCAWITAIFALLVCQGFGPRIGFKPLSDNTLLALITSTTVDIIATLLLVLKYLFRSPNGPARRRRIGTLNKKTISGK